MNRVDARGGLADSSARRTWLVTPGGAPARFAASRYSGADVALLDLEDSVPADGKDAARDNVIAYLAENRYAGAAALGVRVNAPSTVHGLKDLTGLAESGLLPSVLLVPKVESSRDVELVAHVLGTEGRRCEIWALMEIPRSIQRADEILSSPVLAGVLFGAADYAAAAGCDLNGRALWQPRAALALAAAAANRPAVDSPYFDLADSPGLKNEAEQVRELGFHGKVAIHPRQLPVIEEIFRPSEAEVEAARAVVRAADAADGAITTVDGQMVGPPIVARARAIAARAGEAPAARTGQ